MGFPGDTPLAFWLVSLLSVRGPLGELVPSVLGFGAGFRLEVLSGAGFCALRVSLLSVRGPFEGLVLSALGFGGGSCLEALSRAGFCALRGGLGLRL